MIDDMIEKMEKGTLKTKLLKDVLKSMDVNYEITDLADKDLNKALCYFKLIEKDGDFFDDFMNQIRLIITNPYTFQLKYRQIRIISFSSFNYSIHYSIYRDTVFILRVFNQPQDYQK